MPTRRFAFDTKTKTRFTNALLMTDTAGSRRASPARRSSVRRDRGDASARHGDATASCEAMRVRARALVPASPRAQKEASGILGACFRANASFGEKKAAKRRTNPAGSPKNFERIIPREFDEAHQVPENFGALRAAYCVSFAYGLNFLISRAETRLHRIFTVKRTDHFRVRPVERGDARVVKGDLV